MRCPKCKKEIDRVIVVSECWQYGELKGNKIIGYGRVENIDETLHIDCSECQKDITKFIKQ